MDIALLHVLLNGIFTYIARADSCVWVPDVEMKSRRSFVVSSKIFKYLDVAKLNSHGVVQLNLATNLWLIVFSLMVQ